VKTDCKSSKPSSPGSVASTLATQRTSACHTSVA
jgi:hypothetical protein